MNLIGGQPTGAVYTIPRLTVSLTLPLSSSSLRVSADSRDVAAVSRPKARWDMKRSETSSASVCMTVGITTFMYMLPSYDRIEASARKAGNNYIQFSQVFLSPSHAQRLQVTRQQMQYVASLCLLLIAFVMLPKRASREKCDKANTHMHEVKNPTERWNMVEYLLYFLKMECTCRNMYSPTVWLQLQIGRKCAHMLLSVQKIKSSCSFLQSLATPTHGCQLVSLL